MTDKPKRYNHAYTFAFEVISDCEDGSDVTGAMLRKACIERANRVSDQEMWECCDTPYDTYEFEPDDG